MAAPLSIHYQALLKGVEARKQKRETGRAQANPFEKESRSGDAFEAGYNNDLDAWLETYKPHAPAAPKKTLGRLKAHDKIIYTMGGRNPDKGEFLGYAHGHRARVLLNRQGFKCVDLDYLSRPEPKS